MWPVWLCPRSEHYVLVLGALLANMVPLWMKLIPEGPEEPMVYREPGGRRWGPGSKGSRELQGWGVGGTPTWQLGP